MVRVALISTDKDVFIMLENEVPKYAIELVHKISVPSSMLDKAVINAMEDDIDLIIAYCQKPIRNVYKGAAIPVVYIAYIQSELKETVSVMAENHGCMLDETAVIIPDVLLSSSLDSDDTVISGLNIIRIEEPSGITGAVEKAVGGKIRLLLGDEDVCKNAAKVGLENSALKPGKGSIRSALVRAVHNSDKIQMIKRHQLELSVVMNNTSCGIIKVNPRGIIIAINNIASHLLECKDKIVIGRYVLNIFQGLEKESLDTALVNGDMVFRHIIRTKKKGYIVNIEPIIEDNEILSAIILMQEITSSPASAAKADMTSEDPGMQFHFPSFVYSSETFRNVLKKAKFAAYTDAPILLAGEEGTETLEMAQFIHNESGRSSKPFIELECNAWSQQSINELLFGNDGRTRSAGSNKYIVEIAEGGTLFLNHIDELSKEVQFRIYKLMTGYYTLHSEMRRIQTNIRIIATTNKSLQQLMMSGEFREDLYYALSVITISIPALRERKEDISCIVDYWVSHYGETYSKLVHLSINTYNYISEYSWPRNTRQLKHYCQKLVVNTPQRNISEAFARNELEYLDSVGNYSSTGVEVVNIKDEASVIRAALEHNRGNKTKTAEELGISKTTLWRKTQKYGIMTTYK